MKKLLLILICLITVFSILASSVLSIGALSPPRVISIDCIEDLPEWFMDTTNLTVEEFDKKGTYGWKPYGWHQIAAQMLSHAEFVFLKSIDDLDVYDTDEEEDAESSDKKFFESTFYIEEEHYVLYYSVDGIRYSFDHYPYSEKNKSIESIYESKTIVLENQFIDGIELKLWKFVPTNNNGIIFYEGVFDTALSRIYVTISLDRDQTDHFSLDWFKLDTIDNVIPEIQAKSGLRKKQKQRKQPTRWKTPTTKRAVRE